MRLVVVEQLRKLENNGLEINIILFSLYLYVNLLFCYTWLLIYKIVEEIRRITLFNIDNITGELLF
jgi:hypothetical protein